MGMFCDWKLASQLADISSTSSDCRLHNNCHKHKFRRRSRSPICENTARNRDARRSKSPFSIEGGPVSHARRYRSRERSIEEEFAQDDFRFRSRKPTAPRMFQMMGLHRPRRSGKSFLEQVEARAAHMTKEAAEKTRSIKSCRYPENQKVHSC
jgi:hypothetical protein